MRILLPPSESKRPGGTGASLAATGFAATGVGRHRERLVRATVRTAGGPIDRARSAFNLPPAVLEPALLANRTVRDSPTCPALSRYTGVVYDGLGEADLLPAPRAFADSAILIFSGLFGVLGAAEPIPDYRVPAAAVLPRLGTVATSWRPVLDRLLPTLLGNDVVVDLRSTDYLSMWRPRPALAVITVRVLSRRPDGSTRVTSFYSKRGKGRLARALIMRGAHGQLVTTAQDVAQVWIDAGLGTIDAVRPGPDGHVDVVTRE